MLNVMIVDDEERIRLGIEKIFSQYTGPISIVGSHPNGMEAILSILSMKPEDLDVLITDIEMPVMNGLKLIEQVKAAMPDVFVIVLSGYNDFEYARQALRMGVTDFLLKPLDKSELFQLLSRCEQIKQDENSDPFMNEENSNRMQLDSVRGIDEQVKLLLEKEYNQLFDLKRMSDKIGFSPSYVSKMFSHKTGETITDYLNRLRIDKAKQFLQDHQDLKIYEVAHLVGYMDKMYFQKLFKKLVGITPKEYQGKTR